MVVNKVSVYTFFFSLQNKQFGSLRQCELIFSVSLSLCRVNVGLRAKQGLKGPKEPVGHKEREAQQGPQGPQDPLDLLDLQAGVFLQR